MVKAADDLGLLDLIDPEIRAEVVELKSLALRTGFEGVERQLNNLGKASTVLADKVAGKHQLVELLFLNGSADRALEVFDKHILESLPDLPPNIALILADNRAQLSMSEHLLEDSSFYERDDEKEMRRIITRDPEDLLNGLIAAQQGRHFDCVPALWRQLLRSYRHQYWQGQRQAHRLLAAEFAAVGLLIEASWHAIQALDKKLAARIGSILADTRDQDLIGAVVTKLTQNSYLARHAEIACELMSELLDSLPRDHVDSFFGWLLFHLGLVSSDREAKARQNVLWMTAVRFLPHLSGKSVVSFLEYASESTLWEHPQDRRGLLMAVSAGLGLTLDEASLELHDKLANRLLYSATDLRSEVDFDSVLGILAVLAEQNEEIRNKAASELFPPGGQSQDLILLKSAAAFGASIQDVDRLAARAASEVELQVQTMSNEQKPQEITQLMTVQTSKGDTKSVLTIGGGVPLLDAAIAHTQHLSQEAVNKLFLAVLEKICDSENALTNRVTLASKLITLYPYASRALLRKAAKQLSSVLDDGFEESPHLRHFEGQHPLSRFRVNFGSAEDLRAMLVYCLAKIWQALPTKTVRDLVWPILHSALSSTSGEERRFAFLGCVGLPNLPSSAFSSTVLGTQDPDPTVASAAWRLLSTFTGKQIPRTSWNQLVFAWTRALQNKDPSVRRSAGFVLGLLRGQAPKDFSSRLTEIQGSFATDLCRSVREVANETGSSDQQPTR